MDNFPKKMRLTSQKPSSTIALDHQAPTLPSKPNKPSSLDHNDDPLEELNMASNQSMIINGRDRLKRHREEIAGRVLVPDKWGNEESMKEWIDYSSFDALLAPKGIRSARQALIVESQRRNSKPSSTTNSTSQQLVIRIESRC